MSLSDDNKRIAIELLIEKSDRNFQQAIANSELGYWDLVANRLYYSVFHAVTALMLKDGVKVRSHKGSSALFGQYYVLPGKFDREDGILYSRLQTMREKADYQNVFSLEPDEGKEYIIKTEILLSKIKSYLN